MAWTLPVSGSTGLKIDGVTYVRWGTAGLLQSPVGGSGHGDGSATGYYVVTRFSERQLVDVIRLPQGSGITSSRVAITDGVQWTMTVRDDTAMVPPKVGTTVTIVDLGGLIVGTAASSRPIYTATVVDSSYETGIKQPGERQITVENLVLVETQTST